MLYIKVKGDFVFYDFSLRMRLNEIISYIFFKEWKDVNAGGKRIWQLFKMA